MSDIKTVIITGAGSGIGKAAAIRYANEGYNVVLNGRTKSKLDDVAKEIGKPEHILVQSGDVSSQDDVEDVIANTIKEFGRIDVLVNNAGVAVSGNISDVSLEDWDKQMSINAGGMFLMIKHALPHLEKTKGAIVNTSSVSGLGGDWGMFAYNATKGAVSNLTRALALDLGSKNVRVNAVAPSATRTDMASGILDDDDLLKKFKDRIPMQRPAEPEEIADVIYFLSSHDARFVNGVVLPVDGGLSASNGQPQLG